MSEPTPYEIVLRGRATSRTLRALLDDFVLDSVSDGVSRLVGDVNDNAHLHGVVAYLASLNVEVIAIAPLGHVAGGLAQPRPSATSDQRHGAHS